MCKQRAVPVTQGPMGEETYNGFNLSFLSHASFVFSGGSFLLILGVVLTICLCKRGLCFRWLLGDNSPQSQNQTNNPNLQAPCRSSANSQLQLQPQ